MGIALGAARRPRVRRVRGRAAAAAARSSVSWRSWPDGGDSCIASSSLRSLSAGAPSPSARSATSASAPARRARRRAAPAVRPPSGRARSTQAWSWSIAFGLGIVTAIAADLAGRPRFHVAPLASIFVGFTAVMAIAAPVHPSRWPLALLTVGAVLLLFSAPGQRPALAPAADARRAVADGHAARPPDRGRSSRRPRSPGPTGPTHARTSRPTSHCRCSTPSSRWSPCATPTELRPVRDHRPVGAHRAVVPTRWRLSALDQYDGQRWLPAATLRPIGSRLGLPTPAIPDLAPPITYDLTILDRRHRPHPAARAARSSSTARTVR